MTNEQLVWLSSIEERDLKELFSDLRMQRLKTLDNAKCDFTEGMKIQQEIGALHRIEHHLISLREKIKKQD